MRSDFHQFLRLADTKWHVGAVQESSELPMGQAAFGIRNPAPQRDVRSHDLGSSPANLGHPHTNFRALPRTQPTHQRHLGFCQLRGRGKDYWWSDAFETLRLLAAGVFLVHFEIQAHQDLMNRGAGVRMANVSEKKTKSPRSVKSNSPSTAPVTVTKLPGMKSLLAALLLALVCARGEASSLDHHADKR